MFRDLETRVLDLRDIALEEVESILSAWDNARGDRFAPPFDENFNLETVGYRVASCCSIVDVLDAGADYLYRFWGQKNVDVKGFEMTGKRLTENSLKAVTSIGFNHFGEVLSQRKPLAFSYGGPYSHITTREQITFRFPLSDDGESVDKILSYQNLEKDAEGWEDIFNLIWDGERPKTAAL